MGKGRLKELAKFRLDFGVHKGKTLREVPPDYLDWLVNEFHDATVKWVVKQYQAERRQYQKSGRTYGLQAKHAKRQRARNNKAKR